MTQEQRPLADYALQKGGRPQVKKSTFTVIFVIQRGKSKEDGSAPIVARITVNHEMVHFATRLYIQPDRWQPKDYRTVGKTKEEKQINDALDELRVLIRRKYDEMFRHEEVITAGKIKNAITGMDEKSMKLLELCDRFLIEYKEWADTKMFCHETFGRYELTRRRLADFMQACFRISDLPLRDINLKFINDFDKWLRITQNLNNNTTMKFLRRLKTIYHTAITNGWAQTDPFMAFKFHMEKVDRGYLTSAELVKLQGKIFPTKRLELIRDLFLFSCYTGLAYIDLKQLSSDMLQRWPDGNLWIDDKRQKTQTPFHVRLLDVPLALIRKYEGKAKGELLFPVPSNQKVNSYLKEIAGVCGIDKDLTFHIENSPCAAGRSKGELSAVVAECRYGSEQRLDASPDVCGEGEILCDTSACSGADRNPPAI